MAEKNLLDDGQGFEVFEQGGKLVIEIDPSSPGVTSKSGKSKVIASSRGNMPVRVDGTTYYLGLNFYTKK
jgi:hypothetical protein